MLKLNLHRILTLRGIENPYSHLRSKGYQRHKITNLMQGKNATVNLEELEYLCEAYGCTPNDLLEWTPSKKNENNESHPLQPLRRSKMPVSIYKIIETLPPDRLEELERYILEKDGK
ncbi:helix-turn-helix domain-containing protein [Acetobacteroides hydrogenigenes]|uniref:DNA-binding Xre family transcriptional regulator n=1 Tax=Acetobacteroides hydrogenigenes TaxID=979970 RepID=A0A4R2EZZ9_9BACT|nr:helix-turn-helix transcriptional regulator [Acetobacteroides hydrogenigenes]TCN73233.1 DNA-binding Xre family transcriptional regulator [Acetobacteroides hydrogenigenes]